MKILGWVWLSLLVPIAAAILRHAGDGEIVQGLKRRDPQAMSALYDRYGRLTYSIIFRVVRNEAVAEDLLQETFLRIWNRAQAFDGARGALGTWVFTVARNRAIDYLRSIEGRSAQNTFAVEAIENPALFVDSENSAESLHRARVVASAMSKLTPNQRMVIELAYYEGLSQTEMSERLKQPLGTVKTWVRTALKALRDEIGEAVVA